METSERILRETRTLMERHRGKGVRIGDVADAAGVSRQAVYLHFGSRAGLLTATARYLDGTLDLPTRTAPIFAARDGAEMLRAFIRFWAAYIPDIYGLAKALMVARETDDAAAAAFDDRMDALYQKISAVVGRLDSEGLLAEGWSVSEAADYTWSLCAISAWEHLTLERGWSQEQYTARLLQTVETMLLRPGAARTASEGAPAARTPASPRRGR